jgi:hypothetical protein
MDDAQVVNIELTKAYGAEPSAAVRVMELDGEAA